MANPLTVVGQEPLTVVGEESVKSSGLQVVGEEPLKVVGEETIGGKAPLSVPFSRPFQSQEQAASATGRRVMGNPEIGAPPPAPPRRETFLGVPVDRYEQIRQEMEPRPDFIYEGVQQAAGGVGKILTAGPTPTKPASGRQLASGASDVLLGTMKAASPVMGVGLAAAPLETLGVLLASSATSSQVKDTAEELGAPKEYADLAGDIAGILQGFGLSWASLPREGGIRGIIESDTGKSTGGAAGTAARDARLIERLRAMAGQNEQSPAEARIAREILRRRYGVDIPEPATATQPPTSETAPPQSAEPKPAAAQRNPPGAATVEVGHTYETPTGKHAVTAVDARTGVVTYDKTLPDGSVISNIRTPMERFRRMVAQPTPRPAAQPAPAAAGAPTQAPAAAPVATPEDILAQAPVAPQGSQPVPPLSSEQSTIPPSSPTEVVSPPAVGLPVAQEPNATTVAPSAVPAPPAPVSAPGVAPSPDGVNAPAPAPGPAPVAPTPGADVQGAPAVSGGVEPKQPEAHEFSSTQANLPAPVADAVRQLGASIPDEYLAGDGREANPHTTVLYGLHGESPKAVQKLLADEAPITATIGNASVFPPLKPGGPAVLKLDVDSPDLHRLNGKISTLEHTSTFPDYHPHITVAYVDPASVDNFLFRGNEGASVPIEGITGQQITLDTITFSGKDGKTVDIKLGGEPAATATPQPPTVVGEEPITPDAVLASAPAAPPAGPGHFMNEGDIDQSVERFKKHPVLSRATKFLSDLRDETNAHSDGWHSWPLPGNAAKQLMGMIQHPKTATEENFKRALMPIRSFYTRRGNAAGMKFPEIAPVPENANAEIPPPHSYVKPITRPISTPVEKPATPAEPPKKSPKAAKPTKEELKQQEDDRQRERAKEDVQFFTTADAKDADPDIVRQLVENLQHNTHADEINENVLQYFWAPNGPIPEEAAHLGIAKLVQDGILTPDIQGDGKHLQLKINRAKVPPKGTAEPKPAAEPVSPESRALANKGVAKAVDDLIDASDRASRSTKSGSAMAEIEAERLRQFIRNGKEYADSPLAKSADPKQVAMLGRTIELAEKALDGLKAAAKPEPAAPAGVPYQPGELGNYIDRLGGMKDDALVYAKDLLGQKVDPTERQNAIHLLPESVRQRLVDLVNAHKAANPAAAKPEPTAPKPKGTKGETAAAAKPQPQTPEEIKQSGVNGLVDAVQQTIESGGSLGKVDSLTKLAEKHLGSSRTSGNWTPKDMFDAMEAGINKHLIETGSDLMSKPFEQAMQDLRNLMARVTTQGVRTDEQVKLQQFSTPPTESFVAAKAAGIRPSDVVLEPSAGNGGLAVWPKSIGAEVHVNEISERRQEMLKAAGFDNITAHDGEILNAMLDRSVQPTVILMNPPFSAGGAKSGPAKNDNQYGFNHVNAALQRLAPGGRLVAILGGGRADDMNGGATLLGGPSGKWFTDLAQRYNVRANVRIHGREYQKYGTNFATRIIVIDKTGPTPSRVTNAPNWESVVRGNADTLEDAYKLLEGVADDRPQIAIGAPGARGVGAGNAGNPEGRTGDVSGRSDGGVLPGSGRTPETGAVGGESGSGRPAGGSAGARPGGAGKPTDLRQPETERPEPAETAPARTPASGVENADFQRPIPGADDLAASAGMTAQDIIAAAKQALGEKMGKSPAPPPPQIPAPTPAKPRTPRKAAAKKPPAEKPKESGNALSGAADKAMQDLEQWMKSQGGDNEGPSSIQARAADPKPNQPVPPQVLINLATIGGEQMLDGATSFPKWAEAMTAKAGPIISFVAERGNSSPDTVLRQIYQLSSEVAKDFGATAEPLPPAVDQAEQKALADQSGKLEIERDTTPKSEQEDSAAYVTYRPTLKGPAHPGDIVETKTMSTVPLPEITYRPNLPKSVLEDGRLSAVQLEAIAIAGQQNEIILPGGYRASALVGDGTGLGKGRIGAGIMWDNYRQGRKRLVFVTEKWDLMQDIIRDLHGIGAHDLLRNVDRNKAGQWVTNSQSAVRPFNKWQAGTKVQHDGILFSTYALIRSENNKGETRAAQLEQYLRGEDDGDGAVIVFDESHNLKNAVVGQGGQASQIGVAVKNLLASLPKLRTTSLSATAATDVMNLGYLDRLGLWGPGTAFPTGFQEFASQIAGGKLAAMEMVARELKAQGKYLSRTLSFKGVTYDEAEHQITPEQADLYRTATNAWRRVVNEAETSIETTTNGGSRQTSRFLSQLGAAQQRFFNLLITALKTPTAVELAQKALADGKSVVITLVNTNEAAQNREKARAASEGDEDEPPDFDFGPKQMLLDLVREHYPVQQYADDVDDNGNAIKVPVTRPDPKTGKPIAVNNPEAEAKRDALLADIDRDLHMPENPLDILINSLGGSGKVAELTGRKERFDSSVGKFVPRGDPNAARKDVNLFEMRAFQEGKKRIAVLSTAAGTGISLHAGNDVANQQKRYHMTLQVGWSADKAMQMFGRTHRTNQVHPPEYVMLVSDLGGEKRFVSTIARRLGSLGAITKGQKDATSGTDLMDKVNFETEQGKQATQAFYESLLRDQPVPGAIKMEKGDDGVWKQAPGVMTGKEVLSDLRMLSGDPPTVPLKHRQNVTRLLNRLLALDPESQNGAYNYFYDIFQAVVQRAIEQNTLDTGVKTLPGDTISVKEQRPIGKDPKTGAETFYYQVDANVKNKRMSPKDLERRMAADPTAQILRNDKGKLALATDAKPIVHASGSLEQAYYISTPGKGNPVKTGIDSIRNRVKPVEQWAKDEAEAAKREMQSAQSDLGWQQQNYDRAKRYFASGLNDRIQQNEQRAKYTQSAFERDRAQASLTTARQQLAAFQETGELPEDNYERKNLDSARAKVENLKIRAATAEEALVDPLEWAKQEWQRQYDDAPSHTTNPHHLIGGAVMRYWNAVREASQLSNIYTATDSKSGKRVVGVDVPAERIGQLLARITGGASTVNATQLRTDVLRNNLTYQLEGGIQVRRGMIARQPIVQLIPANQEQAANLRSLGVLYERGVMPVHYIPNGGTGKDGSEAILTRVLEQYPVQQDDNGGPGGGGPAPLQSRRAPEAGDTYRRAGKSVDGLTVRSEVPNTDSIAASLNDYEVLPGIREVPISAFETPNSYYAADDQRRVRALADQIKESGEISPLIVVVDKPGSTQQPTAPGQPPLLQEAPMPTGDFPSLKEIEAYWGAAEARPDTVEGQPVVWVNGAAMDAILARMGPSGEGGDSSDTLGLLLAPSEWVNVLDEARVAARNPRPGGFDDAVARVGRQIEQALKLNEPGASRVKPLVVVQAGDSIKPEAIQKVLHEELDHAQQMQLPTGVKGLPVEMLDSAAGKKAVAALLKQGYRMAAKDSQYYEQNRAVMAAEVGARLMRGGRYQDLGLTPEEAVDLAAQYIEGLERMHGAKAESIVEKTKDAIKQNQASLGRRSTDLDRQHQTGDSGAPQGRPQGADQLPAEPEPAEPASGAQPLAGRAREFLKDESGASSVAKAIRDRINKKMASSGEDRARRMLSVGSRKNALEALRESLKEDADSKIGEKIRTYVTGERDIRIAETNQMRDVYQDFIPSHVDQEALTLMRDFKNRPGELEAFLDGTHPYYDELKMTPEERTAAMERIGELGPVIARALNPTPEMLGADQDLTDYFTRHLEEGRKLGFLDSTISNEEYITHLLNPLDQEEEQAPAKKQSKIGQLLRGKLGPRKFRFSQQRHFPTVLHYIAAGGRPKSINALNALAVYGEKYATTAAYHLLIRALRTSKAGKWGTYSDQKRGDIPANWVEMAPESRIFRLDTPYNDDNGNARVSHRMLFVPPVVRDAMRPILDPNYMNLVPGFQKSRLYQAYIKTVELGLSIFHLRALNITALGNENLDGLVESYVADMKSPEFHEAEQSWIRAGLVTPVLGRTVEVYRALQPSSLPTTKEKILSIPGLKQVDQLASAISHLTFGIVQRKFKVTDASLKYAAWIEKNPKATPQEAFEAQRLIAKQVNATYGGLHWENMGVHRMSLEISKLALLAPDWTFSNIANVKYAFEGGPHGSAARLFWLRSALFGLALTAAASLLLSGKLSKDPTQVNLGKDKEGHELHDNMFFVGAPGDMLTLIRNANHYGAIVGTAVTIGGKFGPIPRTGMHLMANQDAQRRQIIPKTVKTDLLGRPTKAHEPGALEKTAIGAKEAAREVAPVPFSVSTIVKMLMDRTHHYTAAQYAATAISGRMPQADHAPARHR